MFKGAMIILSLFLAIVALACSQEEADRARTDGQEDAQATSGGGSGPNLRSPAAPAKWVSPTVGVSTPIFSAHRTAIRDPQWEYPLHLRRHQALQKSWRQGLLIPSLRPFNRPGRLKLQPEAPLPTAAPEATAGAPLPTTAPEITGEESGPASSGPSVPSYPRGGVGPTRSNG